MRVLHFSCEVLRVCDHTPQCRCCGRLGRAEIDCVILGPRPAWEISRERAEAHLAGSRCLSHADAPLTTWFMHARARGQKSQQSACLIHILEHLAASGVHMERSIGMNASAFQHLGCNHEVPVGRIYTATYDRLADLETCDFAHRYDVPRRRWLGDQGL